MVRKPLSSTPFISIEPGLPQSESSKALADTDNPDVKVGEDDVASKDKPVSKEPAKPTMAKASAETAKSKSDVTKPKAAAKTPKDAAKS